MSSKSNPDRDARETREEKPSFKEVEKAFEETPSPSIAQLAGVRATGSATAHFLRQGPRKAAAIDVVWHSDSEWAVMADGSDRPISTFESKEAAVKAARAIATDAAPSELAIRGKDGRVQESHTYD